MRGKPPTWIGKPTPSVRAVYGPGSQHVTRGAAVPVSSLIVGMGIRMLAFVFRMLTIRKSDLDAGG